MPKRRSDSFFGMHFDFHAQEDTRNIGEFCDYDAIDELLSEVKPDYVQCDTKGHAGYSSYPTKIGTQAPDMKGDILKMWREVTEKHDVALYAHHSGVYDVAALKEHPEWAAVDENGNASHDYTSCFGPYVDERLIPQLKEMALEYGLDGAWVDGDCWAAMADYSEWAEEQYKNAYSAEMPKKGDADYYKFMKFCRHGFRDYVNKYVRTLHSVAPDFQIASNWMYSSFMPEIPAVPVDYISGDFTPEDSVNSARFEGRCMAVQGKCWDLMSWGFTIGNNYYAEKSAIQLCQEAASVIMIGGGYQVYNRQLIGTIQKHYIPEWKKLSQFCRDRQQLCHKAEAEHQIGVICSRKAHYHAIDRLYINGGSYHWEVRNSVLSLLDCSFGVEVIYTHSATPSNLANYPCIVVTDISELEPDLRRALLDYANDGGNLVISGYHSAQIFLPYLDIDVIGGEECSVPLMFDYNGHRGGVTSPYRLVTLSEGTEALADFRLTDDNNAPHGTIASRTHYGKGTITGIYFNIGAVHVSHNDISVKALKTLFEKIFTPAVKVECDGRVDVSIMHKDGQRRINLLNLNGEHDNVQCRCFDSIPPIENIRLEIHSDKAPESVKLMPENIVLDFTYENGIIKTEIDRLEIHSAVVID